MKNLLAALLALLLVLLPSGCTATKELPSSALGSGPAPFRIGLVQTRDQASLNKVREAFVSRLEEWGYGETRVSIEYQNAQGDEKALKEICEAFVEDGKDLIVAVSTTAAQAAVSAAEDSDCTVLFASVCSPTASLGLQSPEQPEGNVTGVSEVLPGQELLELALQANPALSTLGVLYEEQEPCSLEAIEAIRKQCRAKGITLFEEKTDAAGALEAAQRLSGKAQAVLTLTDVTEAAFMKEIAAVFRKEKVPYYGCSDAMVREGALAGYSVDYGDVGSRCADMAISLMGGMPVSRTPVQTVDTYRPYVNSATQKVLGISLPETLLEKADFF